MKKLSEISINIRGVAKKFGKTVALNDFTAVFQKETLHGVIGPDGAGKTTLLRLLAGLLRPGEGNIEYFSGDNHVNQKDIRAHIGYMPASASLYPDLSILEHLEFFRRLYRIGKAEYEDKSQTLLNMTRLTEFKDRKISQLSGGMYKKAGLICALLRSPEVLLLDEPTNGVDPISRREFWELLYALSYKKILIIISTAYMDEAERCARVHLLESGKLLESGAPEEVLINSGVKEFDEIFIRQQKDE